MLSAHLETPVSYLGKRKWKLAQSVLASSLKKLADTKLNATLCLRTGYRVLSFYRTALFFQQQAILFHIITYSCHLYSSSLHYFITDLVVIIFWWLCRAEGGWSGAPFSFFYRTRVRHSEHHKDKTSRRMEIYQGMAVNSLKLTLINERHVALPTKFRTKFLTTVKCNFPDDANGL